MAGEILKALCHYPKGKVTSGNKPNRHSVLNCYLKLTQRWILVHKTTNTYTARPFVLGSRVYFGCSSIHADSWLQHTGKITEEYDYLRAFADLDSAWSTASLVSSSEQKNRALRTNTLPNPCWSQRSKEMKCKGKVTQPNLFCFTPTPRKILLSLFPLPYFLSSLVTLPFQEWCHFHYSHGKVLSALVSKVLRNFRKSLEVTLHLSSLSGTHPVHSRGLGAKKLPLKGVWQILARIIKL